MNTLLRTSNRTQQTFQLPDGRILGYAEYGAPQGKPLFYFHGWPSSRIEFAGLNGGAIASELNVRVIAMDRPGFGLSGYQPHHRFTDWPQDVSRLADHLGLDRFALMGYSASGPTPSSAPSSGGPADGGRRGERGCPTLNVPGATKGMPTIMLWTTARIHPRLTWLLFNMMKNTIANAHAINSLLRQTGHDGRSGFRVHQRAPRRHGHQHGRWRGSSPPGWSGSCRGRCTVLETAGGSGWKISAQKCMSGTVKRTSMPRSKHTARYWQRSYPMLKRNFIRARDIFR